jgi:hypothetical protein
MLRKRSPGTETKPRKPSPATHEQSLMLSLLSFCSNDRCCTPAVRRHIPDLDSEMGSRHPIQRGLLGIKLVGSMS